MPYRSTPSIEGAHFDYEAPLINVAGAHVGGYLHMAHSRNDILATIDRMRPPTSATALVDHLCVVRDSALEGALRHSETVMPGYTHLQPAQPITYGFYLVAIAEALTRDVREVTAGGTPNRLVSAWRRRPRRNLISIDRDETARLLGFRRVTSATLIDAVASRDFALGAVVGDDDLCRRLEPLCAGLFRLVHRHYNLIDFPDRVAGTSSIMPQKKNPVVLEYLKGKAGHLIGLLTASLATIKGVNFSHTGDASREGMRSFWEARRGKPALPAPARSGGAQRQSEHGGNGCAGASRLRLGPLTLRDLLVRRCDLSFRESAHHVVGAVVRAALDRNLGADQVGIEMLNQVAQDRLGKRTAPTCVDAEVRNSLDPLASVHSRLVTGWCRGGSRQRTCCRVGEGFGQRQEPKQNAR